MKTKLIKIMVIIISIILVQTTFSQNYDPDNGFHCNEDLSDYLLAGASPSSTGGKYKPERTNNYTGTGSTSIFRILTVFVEYSNDTIDASNSNWTSGNAPTYMNDLLASTKSTNYGSAWWNAYSDTTQKLSDYWMEISRGNFHVIGNSYHIVLSHPWYWYLSNGNLEAVNTEIYNELDTLLGINWRNFDNWTYKDGAFNYESDGIIDMIYVVHRTWRPDMTVTPGCIASLYNSTQGYHHVTISGDTIVAGFGDKGSGCTFTPGAGAYNTAYPVLYSPFSGVTFLTLQAHEIGHYHFDACHSSYGIMAGGGCGYFTGLDSRHSPWETGKLGYGLPVMQNSGRTNYGLYDFSSRDANDTMQVIQVPISGDNEFFLIASRNKVSSYDRIMAGDTAHDNPFRIINSDYGKGIYIYHTPSGYNYYPSMDQECADGLFNWTQDGYQHPDWSNSQDIPYYLKSNVSYDNDGSSGSLYDADEKSMGAWFDIGKQHTTLGADGTDRLFTFNSDPWTSRAWKGDRYDAWRPGYNEVFSPYSSPSTKTWNDSNSGIFIWHYNSSGDGPTGLAYLKIYRVGAGGLSQDSILKWTPPSRPMGLKVVECDSQPTINGYKRIKLTWNHNMEPDMLPVINNGNKKYKIYRNTGENMTDALQYSENYYSLIATVYIHESVQPTYIDSTTISGCTEPPREAPPYWVSYPIRYRVQAVDHYNTSSVLSDFASTTGWFLDEGGLEEGDNRPIASENAPKEYSLKQNYPNPFNPSTTIKYELPFDGNVSIKIYDITGRIIMTLVNENKTAGRYEVIFDGSNFASGIYYYKIESGNFSQVRKMILIK